MKKILCLLIIYVNILSCQSSGSGTVHVTPSLRGDYTGEYTCITDDLSGSVDTFHVNIILGFTDMKYYLIDTTNTICEYFGEYTLTSNIELIDETDTCNVGQLDWTCKPYGLFELRMPNDSIILTQNLQDSIRVIKEFHLNRIR